MKIMNHKRSHLSTIYQVEAHKTIDHYIFVEKNTRSCDCLLRWGQRGYSMVEEDVLNTEKKHAYDSENDDT